MGNGTNGLNDRWCLLNLMTDMFDTYIDWGMNMEGRRDVHVTIESRIRSSVIRVEVKSDSFLRGRNRSILFSSRRCYRLVNHLFNMARFVRKNTNSGWYRCRRGCLTRSNLGVVISNEAFTGVIEILVSFPIQTNVSSLVGRNITGEFILFDTSDFSRW